MALAAIDLFSGIVAPLFAGLGALDALAVDDRRAGVAVAPFQLARLLPQLRVDGDPQTVPFPESEIMIDGAPRCKMRRQVAPLAAGFDEIKDRVDQFPLHVLSRPPGRACLGKTIIDELPFGVRQIRGVSHPHSDVASGQKSTLKSADLLGFLEFSNRL